MLREIRALACPRVSAIMCYFMAFSFGQVYGIPSARSCSPEVARCSDCQAASASRVRAHPGAGPGAGYADGLLFRRFSSRFRPASSRPKSQHLCGSQAPSRAFEPAPSLCRASLAQRRRALSDHAIVGGVGVDEGACARTSHGLRPVRARLSPRFRAGGARSPSRLTGFLARSPPRVARSAL